MTVEQRKQWKQWKERRISGHDPAASFDVGQAVDRVRTSVVAHAASLKPIPSPQRPALIMLGQRSPLRDV